MCIYFFKNKRKKIIDLSKKIKIFGNLFVKENGKKCRTIINNKKEQLIEDIISLST